MQPVIIWDVVDQKVRWNQSKSGTEHWEASAGCIILDIQKARDEGYGPHGSAISMIQAGGDFTFRSKVQSYRQLFLDWASKTNDSSLKATYEQKANEYAAIDVHLQSVNSHIKVDWNVAGDGSIIDQKGGSIHLSLSIRTAKVMSPFDFNFALHRSTPTGLKVDLELKSHSEMFEGGYIESNHGGHYRLVMQGDGNLVAYGPSGPFWASDTAGKGIPPFKLAMQSDGNAVIYGADNVPTWSTETAGKGTGPYRLVMQADRNIVLYGASGPTWASRTQQ